MIAPRVRRVTALAAALVVCGSLAACGTRLSDSTIVAENGQDSLTATPAAGSIATSGAAPVSPSAVVPTARGVTPPTTAATATSGRQQRHSHSTRGAGQAQPSTAATQAQQGGGAPAASGCTTSLAPVTLGQTGIFSGFLAPATAGERTGLSVWASQVNAAGGVQCHPVKLIQLDDASDPATAKSNVEQLIDQDKVAALVGIAATITMQAVRSVVDPDHFPVIGGDLVADDWFEDPNLYPQGGTNQAGFIGPIKVNAQEGAKRMGLLYCVEVSICTGIHDEASEIAAKAGAQLVFQQSTSLTQTSYTSECQNAKAKGVNNLFVAADGSALSRVARSCATIGFHPKFATVGIAVIPELGTDTNIRKDTLSVGAQNPPFTATDVPGMRQFRSAMDTYAPGQPLNQSAVEGYVSGRLFEAAIGEVASAAAKGPITTTMVKQGLGRIRHNTLDGLAPPLTFHTGKPAPVIDCFYNLQVGAHGFAAPQGSHPDCL